jgi:oxygen-independent coproporphyrinogen-3 oxidase
VNDDADQPGIYVHLPFCSNLCPYCDFFVLTGDAQRRRQYVRYLLQEIALCDGNPWPDFVEHGPRQSFDTLYFGGGTPSIHALEDLHALRQGIERYLPVAAEPWMGLEANPEDVTEQSVTGWRDLGISFLSLGVQSFDEQALRFLGRVHDPQDCRRSVTRARRSGIETLSLDLIYGIPGQTLDDWRTDLESALELGPDHLSCYQLTIEPGTPFGFRRQRGQLSELAPDRQADLFFLTHRVLAEHGLMAYEVSNFATAPAHRSRHNSKYWKHTPYLGLGPSAHSFAANRRWWNTRKIKPYEAQIDAGRRPIADHESLAPDQLLLESLMLGLRTPEGVDFSSFPDDSGPRLWRVNQPLIDDLISQGLVEVGRQRLIPTLGGLAVAEAIARQFELLES